ncbi:MAG TPA: cell division protein ZipA C-terminal FtsZ-binding domain-containing protein [Steroidobacteraceae bacterium]|nr:cell division protein ZipA C-terminal FtsZ-binding domain-containing protein [Steroidobacteraceae bacterium]
MAAELRWILLGFSLVLLAGIWIWGARRSAQAPGNAALRESMPPHEPQRRDEPARRDEPQRRDVADESAVHEPVEATPVRDWVSPLEPLSIRTGEFERVPVLDGPMMVSADALRIPAAGAAPLTDVSPFGEAAPRVPTLMPEPIDRSAAAPPQVPNSSERQKILTVRVCAAGEARWSGASLLSALEMHGLAYGRYQVFHRRHVDGRSLFCVASLVEPGTFDVARMAGEEFRGVTMFAVLPGPVEPLLTLDELLAAARGLAQELSGMVQDSKGMPLSPQRAAVMRDDVARFQAALS